MSQDPKKPPSGDAHVGLGEKSHKQSSGNAIHKPGTHTHAEHAAVEQGTAASHRHAYKAPTTPPKKEGGDADVL